MPNCVAFSPNHPFKILNSGVPSLYDPRVHVLINIVQVSGTDEDFFFEPLFNPRDAMVFPIGPGTARRSHRMENAKFEKTQILRFLKYDRYRYSLLLFRIPVIRQIPGYTNENGPLAVVLTSGVLSNIPLRSREKTGYMTDLSFNDFSCYLLLGSLL